MVAANDEMALGLMAALRTREVRVPEDVSVVGFDDIVGAEHFVPALTTIHQDREALGIEAIAVLQSMFASHPVRGVLLQPDLILRESTAACPSEG